MIGPVVQLWKDYRGCPLGVKLRILSRYTLCPYPTLVKWFPDRGEILDVGCGHGLLAFSLMRDGNAKGRRYLGVDHDAEKIKIAKQALIGNSRFLVQDIADLPSESYDCVSLVDVLYCVPLTQWSDLLRGCTRALRPGGLLVVKEPVHVSRWKTWLSHVEETLAVKVFKITKGAAPHFEPLDTYRSHIEAAAATVFDVKCLDPWRPHTHCLILARKAG